MKRTIVLTTIVTLLTLAPMIASAITLQTIVPSDCNGTGGCQSVCDIAVLATNVLDDGIFIAIFLSAIMFAWAGWQLVIAQGNVSKIHDAKNIFWYVTIGLVLVVSAWLIVSVIMSALSNNSNWNSLCNGNTSIARVIPLG